jgi:hypothetical protein
MNKDLIEACKMFLVPVTILFAALGIASTEGLKAGISLVGLATSGAWLLQIKLWDGELKNGEQITIGMMAFTFCVVWFASVTAHTLAWLGVVQA